MVAVLNDRLDHVERTPLRLLVGAGADHQGIVRALTSTRYERLWDDQITEALLRGLPPGWRNPVAFAGPEHELRPQGLYAGDRDLFCFFVDGGDALDLGPRDHLRRGFFVWNSEVGARSFGFTTFWFRTVCGNHIVWGADRITSVHAIHARGVYGAFESFRAFLSSLEDIAGESREQLVRVAREAKAEILAPIILPDREEADRILGDAGFTLKEINAARDRIAAEEVHPIGSRWDWLQGFTAAARDLPNADARVALERKAARILLPAARLPTLLPTEV